MKNPYIKTKTPERIRQLVLDHIYLVKRIANKLYNRTASGFQEDDLVQIGMLGLIEAATRYDEDSENLFRTYADFRIRGAILDELRSKNWLPRSVREAAAKLEKAIMQLKNEGIDDPEPEDLAAKLGISIEELDAFYLKARPVGLCSIEDLGNVDGEEMNFMETVSDPNMKSPEQVSLEDYDNDLLQEAIKSLNEKEQMVLSLYYNEDMNLREIGETLGLTESRVSQIRTKAIIQMKAFVKNRS